MARTPKKAAARPMWGGRFRKPPHPLMQKINASIAIDVRLYAQDIAVSQAHARMLARQKLISAAECRKICSGLARIEREIAQGQLVHDDALEDIHTHIEARLFALIGATAGKLHTGRSRNDQVATDFRLWLRAALEGLGARVVALQTTLAREAETHADALMPGFTHLQIAQPVSYGHYLLAYVEMLARDHARFQDAAARMNESPLGAGALAGSSLPLDAAHTAKALGFARPCANTMDAVAARDFALEALSAASICASHLSRLADEVVLFASQGFGFFVLADEMSTGSSLMPQKRNPDAAELVRAKAGRIGGQLAALFSVMKALPLAYAKDMQEDKEACFDALDTLALCLDVMDGVMKTLTLDKAKMEAMAAEGHSTATDLADWLVLSGVPFRRAHELVGRLVQDAERKACRLDELPLAAMQAHAPQLTEAARAALTPRAALAARTSAHGPAPARVRARARSWQKTLRALQARRSSKKARPQARRSSEKTRPQARRSSKQARPQARRPAKKTRRTP